MAAPGPVGRQRALQGGNSGTLKPEPVQPPAELGRKVKEGQGSEEGTQGLLHPLPGLFFLWKQQQLQGHFED